MPITPVYSSRFEPADTEEMFTLSGSGYCTMRE